MGSIIAAVVGALVYRLRGGWLKLVAFVGLLLLLMWITYNDAE